MSISVGDTSRCGKNNPQMLSYSSNLMHHSPASLSDPSTIMLLSSFVFAVGYSQERRSRWMINESISGAKSISGLKNDIELPTLPLLSRPSLLISCIDISLKFS